MTLPKFGWAERDDCESWSEADGDTFGDAARFALDEAGEDVVYVCECKPVSGVDALMDALETEYVIERAEECRENRPEDCAFWYEDKLFDDSAQAQARLAELLEAAARTWLAEFPGASARIWEAHNVKRVDRADYPEQVPS